MPRSPLHQRSTAVAVLLGLATLVSCLLLPTGTAAAGAADDARAVPLRVVSYNIHTGIGSDGALDLARTAQVLDSFDADVIGLEEVDVHWADRSAWRDQARDLAAALDMRVFFAPIYSLDPLRPTEPRREYGLAILTDLPVVGTQNHHLTRLSTQGTDPVPEPAPGFPEVVVQADGARVHVYATHLDYRADPTVRAAQVADTLAILDQDPAGAQQVLLGDFNAEPDAPELAPLWERLTDSWAVAGQGAGLSYPAVGPVKRIDYVTHSSNVRTESVEVLDTAASDHRPVVADLVVRRGA
jgi:endonuclease/exonuclease/phosphatase family metal-dependent hydrolase